MGKELESRMIKEIEGIIGIDYETFLAPISEDKPSGENLEYSSIYRDIKQARAEDDPNIPLKPGQLEAKMADWDRVITIASETIANKSKDLQLAVWLLEALIHKRKFYGVALGCFILRNLCEKYWDTIFPQIENGDLEYRTNLFGWMNTHLLPTLRLVPITDPNEDGFEINWCAWQLTAKKLEQARPINKGGGAISGLKSEEDYDADSKNLLSAVENTSNEFYKKWYMDLRYAITETNSLDATLKKLCGDQNQNLRKLNELLEEVYVFIERTLDRRGALEDDPDGKIEDENGDAEVLREETIIDSNENLEESVLEQNRDAPIIETKIQMDQLKRDSQNNPNLENGVKIDSSKKGGDFFQSREEAYATLNRVSQYLLRNESHSPGPHLIKLAAEWGTMSTADLFRELFIKRNGQINIFEVLGIDPSEFEEPQQ